MATILALQDFEGASSGANVTNTTSTGFSTVSGSGSVIHSTDRSISGTRSMKVNAAVNNRILVADWATATNIYIRFYFYLPADPPASAYLIQIREADDTAVAAQFGFVTNGDARIRNEFVEVGTNAAVANGQWYRADWTLLGAGDQTCRIYTGANLHSSTTGNASFTITGALTSTSFGSLQIGNISTVTGGWTCYVDYLEVSNSALPAPYSAPVVDPGGDPIYRKVAGVSTLHTIKRRVSGVATTFIFNRKVGGGGGGTGTVSSLLVPSEGCWLGGTFPSAPGQETSLAGIQEVEAFTGNEPDVIHFYKRAAWTTGVSTAERNMAIRAGKDRAMIAYTWKIGHDGFSWLDIANGLCDSRITAAANALKAWPYKFFISFHHEPEDNVGGTGYSAANYVSHFRKAVDLFRAAGCNNAVFAMNYMGYAGWDAIIPSLYPGDSYVDWIGWDPYAHTGDNNFGDIMNATAGRTTGAAWTGFYNWATTNHPTKPLYLGETGCDFLDESPSFWASYLNTWAAEAEADYPALKMIQYWNQSLITEKGTDYVLQTSGRDAARTAYANMANSAYFNAISSNDAP